ncbi:MAG: UbiA family prenyltransferase [Flavobacteriales bacterium]
MSRHQLTPRDVTTIISFVRLPNLLLIVLFMWLIRWSQLEGAFVTHGISFCLSNAQFNFLVFDVLIVTLIGYWINDWYDREIDKINRPNRLLVRLDLQQNAFYLLILAMLCFGSALTLNIAVETDNLRYVWIFPISIVLLMVYAKWWKRSGFIGNVLVSVMIAILPGLILISELPSLHQLASISHEEFNNIIRAICTYAALMFFSNLSREIVKDNEDLKGDKLNGVRSLAVLIGPKNTRFITSSLLLLSIAVELYFIGNLSLNASNSVFAGVITIMCLSLILISFFAPKSHSLQSTLHKVLMLTGVLQLLVL